MSIYISGSLCFDRIMTFNGNFNDHILQDKLHMLNVSFMVESMDERLGGCAGNIAFSLALLDEKPIVVSSAGKDFEPYAQSMKSSDLPLDGVRIIPDTFTATCYITTDMAGNQITGFYPGAMSIPCDYSFPNLDANSDIAIISPGNVDDMRRLPAFFQKNGIPYIFDPGQQLPVLSPQDIKNAIKGSFACITNDYELHMICRAADMSEDEILGRCQWLVTTLAAEGARIRGADGTDVKIPAIPVKSVVDPTGAGDAQRAGTLKGLAMGLAMTEAAKFGSVSASFAIECLGAQGHRFDAEEFRARYESVFGSMPGGYGQ